MTAAPALSVVMPAHNEEALLDPSVRAVVDGLRSRKGSFEVVVVENGSTDATSDVAKALEHDLPEVRVLSLPVADYGQALRAGFIAARGDLVVNFDVDFVDLTFLDRALPLAAGPDGAAVVVGSKRLAGARDGRNPGRRLVTAVFSALLRYGFGLKVSDTHGMKLLRRQPLVPVVDACRFGADLFDTELVLRAERSGLLCEEVPIVVKELRPSRTPIARRVPRTVVGLVRLRLALAQDRRPAKARTDP